MVRNASNQLVTNASVGVRVSVLQGSTYGAAVYVETHTVTTNANGLLTLEIGDGTVQNGSVANIDWGNGPYFLKTEIDPNGGTNYSVTSTQQMLSVPYALYAAEAGNVPAFAVVPTDTGYVLVLTSADGTTASYVIRNGVDGQDGAQGPAGPQGPQGPQGAQGIQGEQGPAGQQGLQGEQGPAGAQGPQGEQGPAGAAGQDGFSPIVNTVHAGDSTVVTITDATGPHTFVIHDGAQGPQGIQGEQGAQGIQGIQGIQGETGPAGLQGEQGPQGPQGEQGPQGSAGAQGAAGVGIAGITGPTTSATNPLEKTYTINYTDGTSTTFVVTDGAVGAQGPQGEQGPAGDQGPQGEQGPAGAQGPQGEQGPAGAQGPQGEQGPAGATGAPGTPGQDGRGIVNITGPLSSNNIDTYTIQYSDNTTSTFTVTNGVDGTNGVGISGIELINTEGAQKTYKITFTDGSAYTYDVLDGVAGPAGPQGPQGDQGPQGLQGLQGEQGPQGLQGEQGPQGLQGLQGEQGPQGLQGEQGPQGLQGEQGPQGVGIASIAKTGTSGNVDTYTITYTDATVAPTIFTVTNGQDGQDGVSPMVSAAASGDNVVVTVVDGTGTHEYTIPTNTGAFTQLPANWAETNPSNPQYIQNKPNLATVATSGNYSDLTGTPTIPTQTSQLTNNSGFITASDVPAQQNADWNATTGAAEILNKPTLATVATSGNYNDLTNKPTIPTVNDGNIIVQQDGTVVGSFTTNQSGTTTINLTSPNVADGVLTLKRNGVPVGTFTANQAMPANIDIVVPTTVAEMTDAAQYAKTTDIPTQTSQLTNNSGFITASDIPAQQNADWNATTGAAQILNKPTLATVATSGNYNDLTNKPTIPAAQVNADWNATSGAAEILNKPSISEIQIQSVSHDTMYFTNGTYAVMTADWTNVTNKPAFATVATTGNYNDLDNRPTIPQRTSDLDNNSGFITLADVPAQVQSDWNEGDNTDPAFIHNKPDMSNYATHAEIAAAGYLTDADMSNFVTKTDDETIGGDKTFLDNVSVAVTGSMEVPSVLNNIANDGSLNLKTNVGSGNCEQAMNFCDMETIYQNILDKFNDLSDEIDKLNDSIKKLNKEKNTPKDGEVCPNTPSVIDVDGNTYSTVRIGNQCWMRENLRVMHWPDSTPSVPHRVTSPIVGYHGTALSGLRYAFTDVMANASATPTSAPTQGICPQGWRVPSDEDFTILVNYAISKTGNAGPSLMASYGWGNNTPVEGQNRLGMSFVQNWGSDCDLVSTNQKNWRKSSNTTVSSNPTSSYNFHSLSGTSDSKLGVRCIRANSNGEPNTVQLPTVVTNAPNAQNIYDVNVSGTDVSLKIKPGVITENDNSLPPITNLTEYGFVYSSTANTTSMLMLGKSGVSAMTTTVSTQPASYPVNVGQSESTDYFEVSGLTSGTTYYYRAYATNGTGTAYGTVRYFVAQSDPKSCKAALGSSYPDHATDVEGNIYPTVALGSQCWMAQNLRTSQYADGSTISGTVIPGDGTLNADYGRLYNFAQTLRGTASTDLPVQGVCPNGWHVPTSDEWDALWNHMKGISAYQCGGNSLNVAKAMASQSGWTAIGITCSPGNDQTTNNASGFNAYPAGYCSSSANKYSYGTNAGFMSTTYGVNVCVLVGTSTLSKTSSALSDYGRSVRCVYNGASSSVAPTVETGTATCTDITAVYNNRSVFFKYRLTGTVHSGSGIAERGICYSNSVTTPTYESCPSLTSTSNNISVIRDEFEPGETYYYRAYAKTSSGDITYGAVKSFTMPVLPTVTTVGVNSYTATTASLSGKVNSLGTTSEVAITSRGVDVRTAQYPSGTTLTSGTVTGSSTGTYNVSVSGLTAGTTYYAIASYNVTITMDGFSKTFKLYSDDSSVPFMVGTKPSVSMTGVTYAGDNQTQIRYTWKGNLDNAGTPVITEKGFVYSQTNITPTLRAGGSYGKQVVAGTSTGSFAYNALFSSPNTTWYVRAYAISALDTVYATTIYSFTTHDYPGVTLSNNYASDYYYSAEVTTTSIRLHSSFNSKSSSSTSGGCEAAHSQGYVYSTSPMTISDVDATSTGINSNSGPSTFGTSVTTDGAVDTLKNLSANTKYYIRAWVRSAAGYTYSNERVIRTKLSCGGILYDQNGNSYFTVTVGSGSSTQCWMKYNLKANNYDNTLNQTENGSGTAVTYGSSSYSETNKYRYYPGGNSSNVASYGNLYNWPAAVGSGVSYATHSSSTMTNSASKAQGICPRGWHVPTQAEWNYLDSKISSYYTSFAPQFAGYFANGYTNMLTERGEYWSSTLKSGNEYYYWWYQSSGTHGVTYDPTDIGKSVRCIQD
ncbi:MAG: hypothetical protein II859_13780 [Bacteroidales bacterium]|nr:hypothetical protein [Bacteroidales bacterium]